MSLDLYDMGIEGGAEATRWQRQHAARKRKALLKRHRAEAAANKKRAKREARLDLKRRRAKWLAGYKRKCVAAKAAGLPKPIKRGAPWRLGFESPQVIDMVGRTFGRLTVIRSAPVSLTMRQSQRCRVWIVKCSCGSPERFVNGTSLRQGNSKSCGCLAREWGKELGHRNRGRDRGGKPLSVKMLVEAQKARADGNIRLARILECAAPAVRVRERRKKRRKRKSRV